MAVWVVCVYSTVTDELLIEHEARAPETALVRQEWGVPAGSPIEPLPVTADRLAFVNRLLKNPLELEDGQAAYLEQYAEYDGEVVDD